MLNKNVIDGYVMPSLDKHGVWGVFKPRPGEVMVAVGPADCVLFWRGDDLNINPWRNFRLYRTTPGGGVTNLAFNGRRMAEGVGWKSLLRKEPDTARWALSEIFSWMKTFG